MSFASISFEDFTLPFMKEMECDDVHVDEDEVDPRKIAAIGVVKGFVSMATMAFGSEARVECRSGRNIPPTDPVILQAHP